MAEAKDKGLMWHRNLQWLNTVLLSIVGFFAVQTYNTVSNDHEKIANHETRITVLEKQQEKPKHLSLMTGLEMILPDRIKIEED